METELRNLTFLMIGCSVLVVTPALAQDTKTTRSGAIACETLRGLEDFWFGVDKLPPGVSHTDFIASLGCARLPEGLPFTQLDAITARVLAVRGQVWMEGKAYLVWLVEGDAR